jgi:hypothetical protein
MSWYMNRPIRIDGALSSTSETKRVTLPSAELRAYSARKVPAMSPIGVPTIGADDGLDQAAGRSR